MELEFDKEIDAILRRARETRGVLVGDDPPKKHLDADTIAAFVENALPQKAKVLYMEHFADCDRCRKQLSHAMSMNSSAAAAPVVSAQTVEKAIPWSQRLFKTQNLALASGVLVLVFSGVLGYLVLQNRDTGVNVSQVTEPEPLSGAPYAADESMGANANTAVQTANSVGKTAPATNTLPANSMAAVPAANTASSGRIEGSENSPPSNSNNNFSLDGATSLEKPAAAPPVTTDSVAAEREEKKSDAKDVKEEDKDAVLFKRKQNEERQDRGAPAESAKKSASRSGPRQNQQAQFDSKLSAVSATRVVNGKTFNNRDGAWYDSTYRGQATVNHRRGTDEYKKLDNGLRNIADTLGGTVVVVWKERAYRIQ